MQKFTMLRFISLLFISNTVFAYGPGDLDNDGEITILDLTTTISIILDELVEPTEYQLFAADPNFDDAIDILDLVQMVTAVQGLIPLPQYPERVLFVGNSYTAYNGGIDVLLTNLVESTHPGLSLTAQRQAPGGSSFESHWNNLTTRQLITFGSWDIVVLQEQSTRPISDPELMYEYGTLLDSIIIGSSAQTVFFMTWARSFDPEMIEGLSEAYSYLGILLEAAVAPVGLAWAEIVENNPDINLYTGDGSHPNSYGTYLTGCVFYSLIYQRSPEGLEYSNNVEMTAAEQSLLQRTAWEIVDDYVEW